MPGTLSTLRGSDGKVYAAFILREKDYNARPLFAAMLRFEKAGPNYQLLEKACDLNGWHFWTKKILEPHEELPLSEVTEGYEDWIRQRTRQHEKSINAKIPAFPRLPAKLVSGLTFIEKAMSIGVLSLDTAAKCGLKVSLPRAVPPPSPKNDDGQHRAPQVQSTSNPVGKDGDGANPTDMKDGSQGDVATKGLKVSEEGNRILVQAMEDGGLSVTLPNQVAGDAPTVQTAPGDINTSAGLTMEHVTEHDLDRVVEDAMLADDRSDDVNVLKAEITKLKATTKRLHDDNKEKDDMISSLNQLTLSLEDRLKFQEEQAATSIIKGLEPALKKAVSNLRVDWRKEVREELDQMRTRLEEEINRLFTKENASTKSTLASFNATISTVASDVSSVAADVSSLAGDISTLTHLGQSNFGAAVLMNKKLDACGVVVNPNPDLQVDIPKVLLSINSKLVGEGIEDVDNGCRDADSSKNISQHQQYQPSPTNQHQTSNLGLRTSGGAQQFPPALAQGQFLTPTDSRGTLKPTTSSPSLPVPPRKASKWDQGAGRASTPGTSNHQLNKVQKIGLPINNSVGENSTSNPVLYQDMLQATGINYQGGWKDSKQLTKEEVEAKIKMLGGKPPGKRSRRN